MSKYRKREQKAKEIKAYAKKASKTFSKNKEQEVEKPYMNGFEVEM